MRECQALLTDIREEEEALLRPVTSLPSESMNISESVLSSAASVLKQTFVILGKKGAYDTSLNMHTATEAQRLLDAHQVAHRAAVSLRQAQHAVKVEAL